MDIALIPSKAAEGTSLSCLEAMACGCALITSYVGGLSDLVINNYNGLLIKPTTDNLVEAISRLLNEPEQARILSRRGVKVAGTFSISRWKKEWQSVIQEVFGK